MRRVTVLSILLVIGTVAVVSAGDLPGEEPGNENRADPAARTVAEARPACPPMVVEMRAALAVRNEELLKLNAELDGAVDEIRALELIKRIKQVKMAAEVEVFGIQLEYARKDGREDAARRLEEAIEGLLSPPRKRAPQPRPAPVRDDATAGQR